MSDPEQARLLTDPDSLRFFEPFLGRERSASQAAAEVGVRLDTLLYRVKVLAGAGLLRVARAEKRAGRPIKLYRSSADAYFIPFETTPYAELEERIRRELRSSEALVARALARTLRESGSEGQRLYRDARGEVFRQSARPGGVTVDFEDWEGLQSHVRRRSGSLAESMAGQLELSDEEAGSLLLELYGLWRGASQPKPDARTRRAYLLQFALVPLEPADD